MSARALQDVPAAGTVLQAPGGAGSSRDAPAGAVTAAAGLARAQPVAAGEAGAGLANLRLRVGVAPEGAAVPGDPSWCPLPSPLPLDPLSRSPLPGFPASLSVPLRPSLPSPVPAPSVAAPPASPLGVSPSSSLAASR